MDMYLSNFTLSEEQGNILVSWTTSSGFTCADITVEHSTDSIHFKPVYIYPGICGSENTEENYTFLFREVVYNKVNYFRIDLGQYGVSRIKGLRIIKLTAGQPKVYPNPANLSSRIVFNNPNRDVAKVTLYNQNGSRFGDVVETRLNQLEMRRFQGIQPGTYYFTIEINGIRTRGRFIFL